LTEFFRGELALDTREQEPFLNGDQHLVHVV
jgi:hypothetical protein